MQRRAIPHTGIGQVGLRLPGNECPEDDGVPDPRQAEVTKQIDKALKDSFPASDPVPVPQPITAGPTEEGSEALAVEAEEKAADDAAAVEAKTGK
jgi:hypothetical protein